jgi:hypothetical protein
MLFNAGEGTPFQLYVPGRSTAPVAMTAKEQATRPAKGTTIRTQVFVNPKCRTISQNKFSLSLARMQHIRSMLGPQTPWLSPRLKLATLTAGGFKPRLTLDMMKLGTRLQHGSL